MPNLVAEFNDLQNKLVECLALVTQIGSQMNTEPAHTAPPSAKEVKKVARRLPKWGRHPKQYNTQILNAFLTLQRKNRGAITQKDISAALGDPDWFYSNFNQMINFGAKNHGKIFERNGAFIEIWQPVQLHVAEYQTNFL